MVMYRRKEGVEYSEWARTRGGNSEAVAEIESRGKHVWPGRPSFRLCTPRKESDICTQRWRRRAVDRSLPARHSKCTADFVRTIWRSRKEKGPPMVGKRLAWA